MNEYVFPRGEYEVKERRQKAIKLAMSIVIYMSFMDEIKRRF